MSQVNNPIGIGKIRPKDWRIGEKAKYFRDLELFIKQVYENITGINEAKAYTVSTLPDPANYDPASRGKAAYAYVSDESGGATLAFCDGTNWRRVQDRAIVS